MKSLWLSFLPVGLAATSGSLSSHPSSTVQVSGSAPHAASSAVSSIAATSIIVLSSTLSLPISSAISSVPESSALPIAASTSFGVTQPIIPPPIVPTSFSPFPTPSEQPVPNVFQATEPNNPPEPGSSIIPDFGPAWDTAYAKAKAKIAAFSLDQKISIASGVPGVVRCVGNIAPIEPVNGTGWPGLCLEDSPLGVRATDFVTGFPTGISTAATFNRRLMRARGLAMGQEHVGKGVNIALGPMMNMGRVAEGGRNWEGFGADPYLTGETAYETILGMQQGGVQACAKHLVDNDQETKRTSSSSDVDDRTQHEIYTHPFLRSTMAGVAVMMCSYNLINGTFACENEKIMNDVVKFEFGYRGFITSDWGATHSTMSVATGLDMTMPSSSFFGPTLAEYVNNGTIPESRVDDMATRILASWFFLKQDSPSFPQVNFDANDPDNDELNEHVDVQDDHYKVVREIGSACVALLKNTNGALPLKKPRTLAIIGSDASAGISGPNDDQFGNTEGVDGVLTMGWGSGIANMTYLITPREAIQQRAREDHTSVVWFFDDFNLARAGNVARKKSAALVFIMADSGEGADRTNLTAWRGGDALVQAVAAQNNNTIVIVHSVGPLILEPWIENPNVTAVLWAHAPGQEVGNSITDVLYGDWNPSGRLPYTIAKQIEDYGAQVTTGGGVPQVISVPYTDGLEIDYRHFDANNIDPRFEFGFGLSYTTFEYSKLSITQASTKGGDTVDASAWDAGQATPHVEGVSTAAWLHRPLFEVSFTITNTGSVAGAETPQLYLNFPASSGEPPSVLRGFDSTDVIDPGKSQKITLNLSRYDLSIWDVVAQGWRRPEGTIGLTIGASSRDGRLKGTVPNSN